MLVWINRLYREKKEAIKWKFEWTGWAGACYLRVCVCHSLPATLLFRSTIYNQCKYRDHLELNATETVHFFYSFRPEIEQYLENYGSKLKRKCDARCASVLHEIGRAETTPNHCSGQYISANKTLTSHTIDLHMWHDISILKLNSIGKRETEWERERETRDSMCFFLLLLFICCRYLFKCVRLIRE